MRPLGMDGSRKLSDLLVDATAEVIARLPFLPDTASWIDPALASAVSLATVAASSERAMLSRALAANAGGAGWSACGTSTTPSAVR